MSVATHLGLSDPDRDLLQEREVIPVPTEHEVIVLS